tara:strand:- start:9 stop:1304 length:1296 start_codon:yes stop_codon:yes gene_type:complete
MNKNGEEKIAIIGIGYVGLPLAVEFSKKYKVVGFDLDKKRVEELISGYDRTNEISKEDLLNAEKLKFVYSEKSIADANIYIITVPTPVDKNNIPNLDSLKSASALVGNYLRENDIVIYESTVFPGCTEEICVPILEKKSGLIFNRDFFCGYSPERINPGDKEHRLPTIVKITSGSNEKIADYIDTLYNSIISAGTHQTSSIAVAEAAKVIENTQRDVNIALINELSIIFNKMNLDTMEVLEAANTKWNFLFYKPGLVGGHCIGVDPYYLTHKAVELGYHPDMILAGRRINDSMGAFVAQATISELTKQGVNPIGAKVSILGLTFKENCPDLRNTRVVAIVEKLNQYNCTVLTSDYCANHYEAEKEFNIELKDLSEIRNQDAIIVAVGHSNYKNFSKRDWIKMLNPNGVLIDVKSIYNKDDFVNTNIRYWRL